MAIWTLSPLSTPPFPLPSAPVEFSFDYSPLPQLLTPCSYWSIPTYQPAQRPSSPSRKRCRPLADVDGLDEYPQPSCCTRRPEKRRRLRLLICTSRLSLPYAAPSSHSTVVGCAWPKPAPAAWGRQMRPVAKNMLRKAAILNRIKREALAARILQEQQLELVRRQHAERLLRDREARIASLHRQRGRSALGRLAAAVRPPSPPYESEEEEEEDDEEQEEEEEEEFDEFEYEEDCDDLINRPLSPPNEEEIQQDLDARRKAAAAMIAPLPAPIMI